MDNENITLAPLPQRLTKESLEYILENTSLYFDKIVDKVADLESIKDIIFAGRLVFVKENCCIYRKGTKDNAQDWMQLSCLGRSIQLLSDLSDGTTKLELDNFKTLGEWYIDLDTAFNVYTLPEYSKGFLKIEQYTGDDNSVVSSVYTQRFLSLDSGAVYTRNQIEIGTTQIQVGPWSDWVCESNVTDDYGSVFISQYQKDIFYQGLKLAHNYVFSFADCNFEQVYMDGVSKKVYGNWKHPIPYDPSMQLFVYAELSSAYIIFQSNGVSLYTTHPTAQQIDLNSLEYHLKDEHDSIPQGIQIIIGFDEENRPGSFYFAQKLGVFQLAMDKPLLNPVVMDGYGSIFASAAERYVFCNQLKQTTERYTFRFNDFSIRRRNSNGGDYLGFSTINHPIKYESSMVFQIRDTTGYIYIGTVDSKGTFTIENQINLDARSDESGNGQSKIITKVLSNETLIHEGDYLAFGIPSSEGRAGFNKLTLTMDNPFSKEEYTQQFVFDEYNSLYTSLAERDQYLNSIKNQPVYTYTFNNLSSFYWTKAAINNRIKGEPLPSSYGHSTINQLIKYDPSMVLRIKAGSEYDQTLNNFYIYIGENNQGIFNPLKVFGLTEDQFYKLSHLQDIVLNLCTFESSFPTDGLGNKKDNLCVAFGCTANMSEDSFKQSFVLTRDNCLFVDEYVDEFGSCYNNELEYLKYKALLQQNDDIDYQYQFLPQTLSIRRWAGQVGDNLFETYGFSTKNHLILFNEHIYIDFKANAFANDTCAIYLVTKNANNSLSVQKKINFPNNSIKENRIMMYSYKTEVDQIEDAVYIIVGGMSENKRTGITNDIQIHMPNPYYLTSTVVVDALGSVYPTEEALLKVQKKLDEIPEYTFTHGDLANFYYTSTFIKRPGFSTVNHPYKYDTSMVLELKRNKFFGIDSYSGVKNILYIYFGTIENGEFVPKQAVDLQDENFTLTSGEHASQIVNLRYFKYIFDRYGITNPYIAFGSYRSNGWDAIPNYVILKRNNPYIALKKIQLLSLTQANKPYFIVPDENGVTRIPIYYSDKNYSTSAGLSGRLIQSGWKYFYANGLPIDVIFYDGNNQPIDAVTSGAQRKQTDIEKENILYRLADYEITDTYPTFVKIPDNAVRYKIAVYGMRGFSYPADSDKVSNVKNLGQVLLEFLPNIVVYSNSDSVLRVTKDIGRAISNARQLINTVYPAEQIATRYFTLNCPTESKTARPLLPMATGFCYGFRPLNSMVSYYTYLSLVKFTHGYNGASQITPTTGYNYLYGFVCTSFISAALGLPFYEGTEWLMQNFGNKMEKIDAGTPLETGDLVLMVRYAKFDAARNYYPSSGEAQKYRSRFPSLFTHLILVSDVMYDKDTGEFTGYKCVECTNIWTREVSATNFVHTISADVLEKDPDAIIGDWRLRLPLTNIPTLSDSYKFEIDKKLDTLNNIENIEIPMCVNFTGDMCYIGPSPKTSLQDKNKGRYWTDITPSQYIYIDTNCKYIIIKKKDYQSGSERIIGRIDLSQEEQNPNFLMTTSTGEINNNFSHYYIINLNKVLLRQGEAYGEDTVEKEPANVIPDKAGQYNYLLCTKTYIKNNDNKIQEDLYQRIPHPGVYEFYCYSTPPQYSNPPATDSHATFYIPHYPIVRSTEKIAEIERQNDNTGENITVEEIDVVEVSFPEDEINSDQLRIYVDNGQLIDKKGDFSEIWFRMIPKPIQSIDGLDTVPYANYVNVNALDVWDEEKRCFSIGNKYQYFVRAHFINKDFGGITYKFRGSDFDSYGIGQDGTNGDEEELLEQHTVTINSQLNSYELAIDTEDDFTQITQSIVNVDAYKFIQLKLVPPVNENVFVTMRAAGTTDIPSQVIGEDVEGVLLFNIPINQDLELVINKQGFFTDATSVSINLNNNSLNQTLALSSNTDSGLVVDWGDGTALEYLHGNINPNNNNTYNYYIEHTYSQPGEYSIQVMTNDGSTRWGFGAIDFDEDNQEINYNICGETAQKSPQILSITFGNTCKILNKAAFKNCTSLTNLSFPSGVAVIPDECVSGCTNLQKVTIPNSIQEIHNAAFADCNNISSVYISDLVQWCNINVNDDNNNSIYSEHNLFVNNALLTQLIVPNTVSQIAISAFQGCVSLQKVKIPTSVTIIGAKAFKNARNLKEINIDSLTTTVVETEDNNKIDSSAFEGCTSLQYVSLGGNFATISSHSFKDCSHLTSVTFDDTVARVESEAFNNTNIKKLIFTSAVDVIEKNAFSGLPITQIECAANTIEQNAFANCPNLREIWIRSSCQKIGHDGGSPWTGCNPSAIIFCEDDEKKSSWGSDYNVYQYDTYTVPDNISDNSVKNNTEKLRLVTIWNQKISPFDWRLDLSPTETSSLSYKWIPSSMKLEISLGALSDQGTYINEHDREYQISNAIESVMIRTQDYTDTDTAYIAVSYFDGSTQDFLTTEYLLPGSSPSEFAALAQTRGYNYWSYDSLGENAIDPINDTLYDNTNYYAWHRELVDEENFECPSSPDGNHVWNDDGNGTRICTYCGIEEYYELEP